MLPYLNDKPYNNTLETSVERNLDYQIALPVAVLNTEINQEKINEIELLLPKFVVMPSDSDYDAEEFSIQIWKITLNMCAPEIPSF